MERIQPAYAVVENVLNHNEEPMTKIKPIFKPMRKNSPANS